MEYLLTKEQLEIYKKAHNHFDTVINKQYKLATPQTLDNELADIYEEVTNEKLKRNWSCNRCCYNAYKKMGKLYYDSLDYYEAQEDEIIPIEETPKKKAGRPKKNK